MLKSLVVSLVNACTRFASFTVAIAVILTGAAGYYSARNFAITTDIGKLISPNLEWRQREIDYEKWFPDRNKLILAVVEAPTPELAGIASVALEQKLSGRNKEFQSVKRGGGGDFFEQNGLLFLPTQEVEQTTRQLAEASPIIEVLVGDANWRGLTGAVEFGLQGATRGRYPLDGVAKPFNAAAETIEKALAGKPAAFSWQELTSQKPPTPGDRRAFLQITPILDFNALEPGGAATDSIRQAVKELDLAGKYQARVRLTGPVPIANEEFATLQEGALVNHTATVLIVLLILWLALKSPKIIVAVFLTLIVGLALTTAVGLMMVGALNLISIAFFVLFVGLGVDFGIQYSVRYRSERYKSGELVTAISKAAEYSAVPLSLAAVATAAGFLSFLPTAYRGVSELGQIAGAGMVIAFLCAITVLPALLKLFNPAGEEEPLGYKFLAPVDRFLENHRVAIIASTLAIAVAGLPLLYYLRFDFNPINLRSPKVESIATYLDLRSDPNTSTNAIEVIAANQAEAKQVMEKLSKLPEVSQVRSLDSFVPQDQQPKLRAIRNAARELGPALKTDPDDKPPTDAENMEAVRLTIANLRKVAGNGASPGAAAARRLANALDAVAKADKPLRDTAEAAFVLPLKAMTGQLGQLLQAKPVTDKTLPQDLQQEWRTPDGRVRVEALPSGDPNDNETLRKFAAAVKVAAPSAIGGPVSILESGDTIVKAFIQAGAWALLSIAILLWIVLRRIGDVLLTLLPLILAGVVTLEICVLIGLPMNFANIIALPLLLGIGVAFKIYYVTAWRAGQTDLLQSSLTRAIFWSALTTATAFGSLWLSSHPGTSSMGKLLALSLVTTLAAAVLFQPALMGKPREIEEE
ncbi:MAG: hopanoid biosynthesis-associated RND transporter HpnN [Proteobacteria bacterium SG_bin9]|nr:MAG: hopanoid biosynthesis-associated RND transporter HpnN [Proteobacteria bacterium SG_bin9]